ncbi:restriction endonuclease subunit S [Chromobacterium violaceum]|uniref:restriction endonuclease subunit S n=1 Tax=Chromobacterium violaceum TaxID=536 RepID=UPI0015FDCA5E|nr:restriction endonuclease subunit S [Chromobacterium violaceum]MBA8735807.1 restriction endonuclease subunit S [Chromobacterium violaceum]
MSSEWFETTIGEQLTLQRGFDITKAAQRPGRVPVISSGGTNSFHDTSMVKGPGVVLGRKGVVGSVYFVEDDFWPHDTTLWVKDFHGNDALFAYYFFLSKAQELAALDVGSANPTLNRNHVHPIRVNWPTGQEQVVIARLLGTLDDRIILLRETNATLEAIAQALFKSWFVDFDPVRAKQEGRAPEGMDEATAALFPDGFEESALGLVPRGWQVCPIGDVVESVGGGTPDTKESSFWEPGEYCWTTPKDLSGVQAPVLLTTERKLSAKGLNKVSSGLLPAGTLLMSSRAPIGYLAIAQTPLAINQGYIAMLPSSRLPPLYMLFWCRHNMENIKGRANGSTFMEISKKAFRPIPALVPPTPILDAFNDIAGALFERVVENEKQSQTLASLRDTLLPRLISGQLRLPEAMELIDA